MSTTDKIAKLCGSIKDLRKTVDQFPASALDLILTGIEVQLKEIQSDINGWANTDQPTPRKEPDATPKKPAKIVSTIRSNNDDTPPVKPASQTHGYGGSDR